MDIVQKSNSNCDYFPPSSVSYRSYRYLLLKWPSWYSLPSIIIYLAKFRRPNECPWFLIPSPLFSWGWLRLSALGTSATVRPVLQVPYVYGAACGRSGKGNSSSRRETCSNAACSTRLLYDLTPTRARAGELGTQPLTAWVTARPMQFGAHVRTWRITSLYSEIIPFRIGH
jgi:hypothetical protein